MVNGVTHTFILDSHALVQTQRAARQGTGFNGLTIGRGSGIPHALTGFCRRAVIYILIGIRILQRCLAVVEADDAVRRVAAADFSLAVDTTPREQQDCAGYNDFFHGSL